MQIVKEKLSFKMIHGPCAYVLWLGESAQYVGQSKKGMQRAFAPKHKKFEYDRVTIIPYALEELDERENDLIQFLNPRFNVTMNLKSLCNGEKIVFRNLKNVPEYKLEARAKLRYVFRNYWYESDIKEYNKVKFKKSFLSI